MTAGISGGGDLYIGGTAGPLDVHVSGGGDFHGYDLAADIVRRGSAAAGMSL